MTPYWDNFITCEQLRIYLQQGYELFDLRNEDRSHDMKKSYPAFEDRDFRVYFNGNCVGYTSPEIAKEFLTRDA